MPTYIAPGTYKVEAITSHLSLLEPSENLDAESIGCIKAFHAEHLDRMEKFPASIGKHHMYPGGYYDHILECLENVTQLWPLVEKTANFTLDDAIVTAYFHDIYKLLYKYELDDEPYSDKQRDYAKSLGCAITSYDNKSSVSAKIDAALKGKKLNENETCYFRYVRNTETFEESAITVAICSRAGILLSNQVIEALGMVHGGFSALARTVPHLTMSPLAVVVHTADMLSAFCQNNGVPR